MNIDWSKVTDLKYWLEGIAGGVSATPALVTNGFFYNLFLYLFTSFFVLGVCMKVSQAFLNDQHPLQKKFPTWSDNFIWMGILGLTWFVLRNIQVGFLGARVWIFVGFIWFAVLMYFIIKYFIQNWNIEYTYFKNKVFPGISKK